MDHIFVQKYNLGVCIALKWLYGWFMIRVRCGVRLVVLEWVVFVIRVYVNLRSC